MPHEKCNRYNQQCFFLFSFVESHFRGACECVCVCVCVWGGGLIPDKQKAREKTSLIFDVSMINVLIYCTLKIINFLCSQIKGQISQYFKQNVKTRFLSTF